MKAVKTRHVKFPFGRLPWALGIGAVLMAASMTVSADNLLDVFMSALDSDPEYLATGADNRATQEIREQALAGLRPSVSMSASGTWYDTLVYNQLRASQIDRATYRVDLNVTHPVIRPDREIMVVQADSRIAGADALYAAARQDLMVRVGERYFGVLEAEDQLRFARATLEAFDQQLAQSRQRFEVGLIAITDVEEAKAGYDLSRAQLLAAENALDIAREALRETTGEYQENLAPLGDLELMMPEPADIDGWTEIALEHNLRLLAARHDAETARREIDRADAGDAPVLDAVGSMTLDETSHLDESLTSSVGLRLYLPLFDGGSVLSRTRESRHRYQQAIDILELQRRRAQRETRGAYLGVDSGISRVHALEQAVRSSQTAAEAIEAGFQVGTRTSVDVLDAQRELFRARRDLAGAKYGYILDVLRLKRAAGVLAEEDLWRISIWLG